MTPYDDILKALGLDYSELEPSERESYDKSLFEIKSLSLDDITDSIIQCKYAVELELVDLPDTADHQDKNCKLKARLKNYIVLEAMLLDPARRLKVLKRQVGNLKK